MTALRWRQLIELLAITVVGVAFPKVVPALLAHVGIVLPEMPLLRHAYLLFGFVLATFAWLMLRGEKPADFALVVPRRLHVLIGRGVLMFLVITTFEIVGRPVLDPIIQHLTGADPEQGTRHFVAVKDNLGLLLYLIPLAWTFAAFGEEIFYRGFVMTRAAQVLGGGRAAWIAAVFVQALPFALGHGYQGAVGMASVFVVALCYGAAATLWGRNLWPAIIAHGLQDTFAFTMIYFGLVNM
jgi:membrane protease YdiL (CAAX protease family)